MATIGAGPTNFLSLDAQEGDSAWQISLDRTQDQRRLPVSHQTGNPSQLGFFYPAGYFCVDPADAFQQGSECSPPSHRVLTTDHYELFRIHPRFPSGNRTEPAPHVEIGNGRFPGMSRQQRKPDSGEPEARVSN